MTSDYIDVIVPEPAHHGNPGYLKVKFFNLVHGQTESVHLMKQSPLHFTINIQSVRMDLQNATMQIEAGCKEIAESIALGLSVSLLFTLCEPQPQKKAGKTGIINTKVFERGNREVRKLNVSKHKLIHSMGYNEDIPSNSWLYWYYYNSMLNETGDHMRNTMECNHVYHSVYNPGKEDGRNGVFCPWNPDGDDADTSGVGESESSGSGGSSIGSSVTGGADTSGCGGCGGCSASCASSGTASSGGGGGGCYSSTGYNSSDHGYSGSGGYSSYSGGGDDGGYSSGGGGGYSSGGAGGGGCSSHSSCGGGGDG